MAGSRDQKRRRRSKKPSKGRSHRARAAGIALVGVGLAVLCGVVALDTVPLSAETRASLRVEHGRVLVVDRVSGRLTSPSAGDLVLFRDRRGGEPAEQVGRVLAPQDAEVAWRAGRLEIGNEAVDLQWSRGDWRPSTRDGEGFASYVARFARGPGDTLHDPPPSTGLHSRAARVPRHHLYVVSAVTDGAVEGAFVPLGDITGLAHPAF